MILYFAIGYIVFGLVAILTAYLVYPDDEQPINLLEWIGAFLMWPIWCSLEAVNYTGKLLKKLRDRIQNEIKEQKENEL